MTDETETQPTPETKTPPAPVPPAEGRHVLHGFYRLDPGAVSSLDDAAKRKIRAGFSRAVRDIRSRPETQLLLWSCANPKADFGWMLVADDLHFVDSSAKALVRSMGPAGIETVAGYLSMTELSEYTTTEEEYRTQLVAEEGLDPRGSEFEQKLEAFRARMSKYSKDRLYPNLPAWPVACFYPMSKLRIPGQNWFSLPVERRKELMRGHAKVGRAYAGRVLQLITGSTGLDAMEWGVTLFAKSTSDIKSIVYEMRFDPASANYAEFGDFYIGLSMEPGALLDRLGLREEEA